MRIVGILPALVVVCLLGGRAGADVATPPRSSVFVTMPATGGIDAGERLAHANLIRHALQVSWIDDKHVDVHVSRLTVDYVGNTVEVVAVLGFVLSTTGDQMASIGHQTAKLVLPRSQVTARKLPGLRREVIQSALGDLLRKLRPRFVPTV